MREDTKVFLNDCLLCIVARLGNCIRRSLSMSAHDTQPGSFLHFDFLVLGRITGTEKYVLVLKDDLGTYRSIEPVSCADAENAEPYISIGTRDFTAPDEWILDQSTYFMNELPSNLAADYTILHQPTVANSPWANMQTVLQNS